MASIQEDKEFTAVIYFHGMGNQRRFQEVGRFVDMLEKYVRKQRSSKDTSAGKKFELGDIGLKREENLDPYLSNKRDVYFISAEYSPYGDQKSDGLVGSQQFRFYEAYWAPATAGGLGSLWVVWWLLQQLLVPLRALVPIEFIKWLTPWRFRPRNKLARLHRARAQKLHRAKDQPLISRWIDNATLMQVGESGVPTDKRVWGTSVAQTQRLDPEERSVNALIPFSYVQAKPGPGSQARREEVAQELFGEAFRLYGEWAVDQPTANRADQLSDFIKFVEQNPEPKDSTWKKALMHFIGGWHRYYLYSEFMIFFTMLTLLAFSMTMIAFVGAFICSLFLNIIDSRLQGLLQELVPLVKAFRQVFAIELMDTPTGIFALLIRIFALVGFIWGMYRTNTYLRDYVGDVQYWTTYTETDTKYQKRRKILEMSASLIRHVLKKEQCTRVVVVAHSLGSAIAVDTLGEIGWYYQVREGEQKDLEKLDQFITLGSPVDIIQYLFESFDERNPRYNKTHEQLLGNVGTLPFFNEGLKKPLINWINYWDPSDLISRPVYTVFSREHHELYVTNVEVSSCNFPDPIRSHAGYFHDCDIGESLGGILFENNWSVDGQEKPPPTVKLVDRSAVNKAAHKLIPIWMWLCIVTFVINLKIFNVQPIGTYCLALSLLMAFFLGVTRLVYGRYRCPFDSK